MKNVRITFRLSPYQLARGLQTIRQLEPEYHLISINDLVKTIYHDYLSKMTLNRLDRVPDEIMAEILDAINSPAESITLADVMHAKNKPARAKQPKLKDLKPAEPKPAEPKHANLSDDILAEINKLAANSRASSFYDPNDTDSDISTITDFSPPKDWME